MVIFHSNNNLVSGIKICFFEFPPIFYSTRVQAMHEGVINFRIVKTNLCIVISVEMEFFYRFRYSLITGCDTQYKLK